MGSETESLLKAWPVLREEVEQPYFAELMRFVREERATHGVYPPPNQMFAAFELTPYDKVKVVILGQDPYHQPGQAMGLSFSVPRDVKAPPSLSNIGKAMVADGVGQEPLPHGDLTQWAEQGVLLLNTALSVRQDQANSHAKEWKQFTDAAISRLDERDRPVVFVLWGQSAQKKLPLIHKQRDRVVDAPHPAARGPHQSDFRSRKTFSRVNALLEQHGEVPIDWALV